MILNLPPALSNLDEVIQRVGRDAILIGIGALDQKLAQLFLLRRIELARAAWFGAVEQTLQPFCVIPLDGVAKRLPFHACRLRRRANRHASKRMSNSQHATARPIVLLRPRKPQQPFLAVKIATNFCSAPHDAPESMIRWPSMNHAESPMGIPLSQFIFGSVLQALQEGQIEAFVYDRPLLSWIVMQQFPETLRVLDFTIDSLNYAIAVPKGSRLLDKLNSAVLEETESDWWQQTLFQYLRKKQ
jgi:hypothetical protein